MFTKKLTPFPLAPHMFCELARPRRTVPEHLHKGWEQKRHMVEITNSTNRLNFDAYMQIKLSIYTILCVFLKRNWDYIYTISWLYIDIISNKIQRNNLPLGSFRSSKNRSKKASPSAGSWKFMVSRHGKKETPGVVCCDAKLVGGSHWMIPSIQHHLFVKAHRSFPTTLKLAPFPLGCP